MKRLLMLIPIMFLSLIAFSQAGTKTIITDSSVILPKNVGREVVKDILRKDSCEEELSVAKENVRILKSNNDFRDKIISSKDSTINDFKHLRSNDSLIINKKDQEINHLTALSKDLGKQVKKAKRKSTLLGVGGVVAVVVVGTLLILK